MDELRLGLNQYCGPAVLSIFTGLSTDTCADAISRVNGKHKITGVIPADLIKAGELLGIEIKKNEAFTGRSLFWSASAISHFVNTKWIIVVPKHYIAIEVDNEGNIQICDNHTKTPINLQNSARLSQKVEEVFKVTKVRDYIVPKLTSIEWEINFSGSRVLISRIHKFDDGTAKLYQMGSFEAPLDKNQYQEIAFALMKLGE